MSHQEIIHALTQWIDEHIDQPLNIDVVAKKSGYSKWYLQRMFRTVMHQTLGEYIRKRRLQLAAQELRTTRRPIFDIAMDYGYVSQQTADIPPSVRPHAERLSSERLTINGAVLPARHRPGVILLQPGDKLLTRQRF